MTDSKTSVKLNTQGTVLLQTLLQILLQDFPVMRLTVTTGTNYSLIISVFFPFGFTARLIRKQSAEI